MQLNEQIAVLTGADRVRIYRNNAVAYEGYIGNIEHRKAEAFTGNEEVKRLRIVPELRHRKWQELGLMQPFNPAETPDYCFSDLQLTLYTYREKDKSRNSI